MLELREARGLPDRLALLVSEDQLGRPVLLARMELSAPPVPKAIPASQVRSVLLARKD